MAGTEIVHRNRNAHRLQLAQDVQAALDEAGVEYSLSDDGWTLYVDDTPQGRKVLKEFELEYSKETA